jgi:hypothetical protein
MHSRFIGACFAILLAAMPALAGGDDWLPINLADPSLKTPIVERDADAEAIFWDVRLDNSGGRLTFSHYLRVKVFTERGRDLESKIDITYAGHTLIDGIAARTIKPDGSIIELKPADIFERTIVKLSGVKVKARSFVLPGVEPGAIVEYRWREVYPGGIAYDVPLPFQRNIPVREVSYHFRPILGIKIPMRVAFFHMPPVDLVPEPGFFFRVTMNNVEAFREQPYMPPEDEVRPWALVYYSTSGEADKEKYWQRIGKLQYDFYKKLMKVDDAVRRAGAEAIGNAMAPDEKLQRLFDYCRTKVKNLDQPSLETTAEDLANRKENKTPSDTLKHGEASGFEINMLFGALAVAAGFDARKSSMANRGKGFFEPGVPHAYFLSLMAMAVKVGDRWRFYNPGAGYVPSDMLPWYEEGEDALISDPDNAVFAPTPMSPPEKSGLRRTATLRLSEDGTIEGDVRVDYIGHSAVVKKKQDADDSPAQREQSLRAEVTRQMSSAELSNISLENITNSAKPLPYSYHVRVAGYAQRTGKRLFVQPSFFKRGLSSVFSSNDRKFDIYFRYPWSELDQVTIELPDGYVLETRDPPISFEFANNGTYSSTIEPAKEGRAIVYKREFYFGVGGTILFPRNRYSGLKAFFDKVQQQDNLAVTVVKPGTTTASAEPE